MAPSQRRRSIDSSSSTSEAGFSPDALMEKGDIAGTSPSGEGDDGNAQQQQPARGHHEPSYPPPSYSPPSASTSRPVAQVPPSGYRIPLGAPEASSSSSPSSFPDIVKTREAPFMDKDGKSPVFIGSALMQNSVHPCKIVPSMLNQACRVAFGGGEVVHQGRYDLLPFVPALMEFVPASNGHVPDGRKPVKGGFEQYGTELYHAVAVIEGVKVPGKTGIHLVRARFFWTYGFNCM